MKYKDCNVVEAVYDNSGTKNPLIEALPQIYSKKEFIERMQSFPALSIGVEKMTLTERKRGLSALASIFIPLDYMYIVYDSLYQMIQAAYMTKTTKESVQRINQIFLNGGTAGFSTQAESGSLLGTPGIGKSSCIRRCLSLIPQTIAHKKYFGTPFFCKQVTYLFVECPSDCSIKTMTFNIVQALDYAAGTNHLDYIMRLKSVATSAASTFLKTLCLTYHVGVIVIDEIQNLVETAQRTKRVKPLIRFLVELTNDTSTGIFFVGTPLAEAVFTEEEHLRRRTRGIRLIPFKPDGGYRMFLERLWEYQYTPGYAPLTDKMARIIYDYSGGIPDYTVKIFREAQSQALMHGIDRINEKCIQHAVSTLSIKPPSTFDSGTSISDFMLEDFVYEQPDSTSDTQRRFYANTRGRKAEDRDAEDLIIWFKEGALVQNMKETGILEELPLC